MTDGPGEIRPKVSVLVATKLAGVLSAVKLAPADPPPEAGFDFRGFYRETVSRVHHRLRILTGPGDHLEDLVQQTYLELHRSLPRFRRECRLTTFLTRITINVALQHRRKNERRPPPEVSLSEVELGGEADQDTKVMAARALDALFALPEALQVAFVLYEVEQQTLEEIAAATGTSISTAHARVKKAKKKLLKELGRRG